MDPLAEEALAEEALAGEALAGEALAEEALAEEALAEEALAVEAPEGTLAEGTPVDPPLIVSTTGAPGRESVPAGGSVFRTVPWSSSLGSDLMAATEKPASERDLEASSSGRPATSGIPPGGSGVVEVCTFVSPDDASLDA
ncbi:MAG: hypothetical protein M3479_01715, partial [Actinomycetota bacterium]|nr:hypothetical protein [Actinomycetota bacterium]